MKKNEIIKNIRDLKTDIKWYTGLVERLDFYANTIIESYLRDANMRQQVLTAIELKKESIKKLEFYYYLKHGKFPE